MNYFVYRIYRILWREISQEDFDEIPLKNTRFVTYSEALNRMGELGERFPCMQFAIESVDLISGDIVPMAVFVDGQLIE